MMLHVDALFGSCTTVSSSMDTLHYDSPKIGTIIIIYSSCQAMILHLSCINYQVIFSLSNMIPVLSHRGTDCVYIAKHNRNMHVCVEL